MELFGPLVELVEIVGSFTLQFVPNAAPQTMQLGPHSPCVNMEKVINNELVVTPMSVRGGGQKDDLASNAVVFGTCGPSGLTGLAARLKKPGLAHQDSRRVDFAALKAELDALESIGIDIAAGAKAEAANKQGKAATKHADKVSGRFLSNKERKAQETEERGDECFWDGLYHEKLDDPIKLFYCPIIESRADCGLGSRLAYTEASRLFGRCIDLDKTHLPYYAKRCAALCKLRMFQRALADAHTYANTRPDSPTGHCLQGIVYDGLNRYNEAIASLQKSLEVAEIIPYDGSRV